MQTLDIVRSQFDNALRLVERFHDVERTAESGALLAEAKRFSKALDLHIGTRRPRRMKRP